VICLTVERLLPRRCGLTPPARSGVALTEDFIAGCISLTQGVWTIHDAQEVETGGAANTLTSTTPTLPSQGSRTHSVFVEVTHSTRHNE